ncbi:RAMP superfamily CRISPR-associated protein [Nocardiopsis sp. L17-MgMaSL7]|uniref:RAMP superfamily CRISPR-associated protein n=1 Tax=Nocardiopsis sp. L17-MgMaSL7 TaxID=1938893 RepID=UPI000D71D634|nr:RAMP superfamily CRISPR-associated protein [Nocardiopsis sp. L17-MgMaSL7]PWV46008.1 RAMP superfamily protein [Nocardiopsis sp. L17-MgMaSL7]
MTADSASDDDADPHGPGPTGLVWEFAVRLRLLTDAHVGAARATPRHVAESDVDLRLDRDPLGGAPRLRATTLAGLLRHELLARTADPESAAALLGSADTPGAGARSSALDLDDAHAVLPGRGAVPVRVGTRVDPATGSVRPGRMWQWEVLPAGTVFTAHLRLRAADPVEEARLLALVALAARGLADEGPGIRIGGRTGRGHGAVRATRWSARRHDLTDEEGWFAYHARDWPTRWREAEQALSAAETGPAGPSCAESAEPAEVAAPADVAAPAEVAAPPEPVAPAKVAAPPEPVAPADVAAPAKPVAPAKVAAPPEPAVPAKAAAPTTPAWVGPPRADEWTAVAPGAERHPSATRTGTDLVEVMRSVLEEHGGAATLALPSDGAGVVDRRRRAELRMELHVAERTDSDPASSKREPRPATLLIGDAPVDDRSGTADRAHRRSPAGIGSADGEVELRPVLGDTALFALFKRIGRRLVRDAAEHLAGEGTRWREWHGHWWGDDTGRWPDARSAASRVRLRATPTLTGGAPVTTTRLTVDALFGDEVDGHLFTTELHCGGSATVVLDVSEPDDAVRGLLALVVRELATVPLDTLGAGAGTGSGRLLATRAVLTSHEGDGSAPREVDLLRALTEPDGPDAATAREWLPELHRQITPAPEPGQTDEGDLP